MATKTRIDASEICDKRSFFRFTVHCMSNHPLNDVKPASQTNLNNNNTFEECKKETLKPMRKYFCALS